MDAAEQHSRSSLPTRSTPRSLTESATSAFEVDGGPPQRPASVRALILIAYVDVPWDFVN